MSDDESSSSSSSSSSTSESAAAATATAAPPAFKKPDKKRSSPRNNTTTTNNNNSASNIRVEICVQEPNPTIDPVICSFPSGLPASCLTGSKKNNGSINSSTKDQQDMPKFIWEAYHAASSSAASSGSSNTNGATEVAGRSLMGQDHACIYTCRASPLDIKRRHTKVAVGIYDKQTNKLTIQPVACNGHVFALEQSVPAYHHDLHNNISNNAGDKKLTMQAAAEHGRALFEDFGSAKKRKVLKSQQANRVTVDSVVGAGQGMVVSTIVQGQSGMSESNRLALVAAQNSGSSTTNDPKNNSSNYGRATSAAIDAATEQWRSNFLPKFNLQATEPFDVYSMSDIAGPSAWDRVMSKVTRALADETGDPIAAFLQGSRHAEVNAAAASATAPEPKTEADNKDAAQRKRGPEWNPSMEQLIRTLVPRHGKTNSSSDKMVQHQLACTVLLNHFVNLYRRLAKQRFIPPVALDRPRYFGAPLEVGERWLQLFTTADAMNPRSGQTGHVMSKSHRDKCHVHLLLLYLVATSGKSVQCADIKPLAQDLQMDLRDATHLLRLAGCKTSKGAASAGGKTSAALKVPLTFPPPPKRGGAAKR